MSSGKTKKDDRKTMKNLPVTPRCVAIVFAPADKVTSKSRETGTGDVPPHDGGAAESGPGLGGRVAGGGEDGHTFKAKEILEDFKLRNKTCYWNPALSESVSSVKYVGYIAPHTVLVQGDDVHLENIRTAWGRRVLKDPANYTIKRIGDVSSIQMEVIPQTQFIPLPEALCLIMMDLNNNQLLATLDTICERLQLCYHGLQLPGNQLIYETLGLLIRERKVFHTGCGYFVVTPDTFRLHGDDTSHSPMSLAWTHLHPMYIPASFSQPPKAPMRSISCQADVTKDEDLIGQKMLCDKAEIEIQKEESKENDATAAVLRVQRSLSLSGRRTRDSGNHADGRHDSLKRSSSVKGRRESQEKPVVGKKETKQDKNKAERTSLFTKLFGRSRKEKKPAGKPEIPTEKPAVEYATFSAQFPPPEWAWYQQQLEKHSRTETWIHQQVEKSRTWHHLNTVHPAGRGTNTSVQPETCATLTTTQPCGILRHSKRSKSHKHNGKDRPAMVIANRQQAEIQDDYQRESTHGECKRDITHKEHRKSSSHREKENIYKDYHRDSAHRSNQKDSIHGEYADELKHKRNSLPTNDSAHPRLKLSSLPTRLPTDGQVLQSNYITHPKYSSTPRVNPIPEAIETLDCTTDQLLANNTEIRRSQRSHKSHKSKRRSHHDRHSCVTPQYQDISYEYQGRLPNKTLAVGMSHSSGVNCVGLDATQGQGDLTLFPTKGPNPLADPAPLLEKGLKSTGRPSGYHRNSHHDYEDTRHFKPIQGEESHIYANVQVITPTEPVPKLPDRKQKRCRDYYSLPPPNYDMLDNDTHTHKQRNHRASPKDRLEVPDTEDHRSEHSSEPGTAGSRSSQERSQDSVLEGSHTNTCSSENSMGTVIHRIPPRHRQLEGIVADTQELTLGDSGFSSPRVSENSSETKKCESNTAKEVNSGSYLCNNIKTGKQLNNSAGKLDLMTYSSDDSYGQITADALYENSRINKTEMLNNMKYLHKQITVSSQNLTSPELEPDHYSVPENTDSKQAATKKFKLNGDFHVVGVV